MARRVLLASIFGLCIVLPTIAQTTQPATPAARGTRGGRGAGGPAVPLTPEAQRAQQLRGEYGRYRTNNDLLSYGLDLRVDPAAKRIAGKNTITFKMLKDDDAVQIDLTPSLGVDKVVMDGKPLTYEREAGAVLVRFAETLKAGQTYAIDFHYSGVPGRGFTFGTDPAGRPWIYTSVEGPGSSAWWPSKDQWTDEVEGMKLSVAVPSELSDVSNGTFVGKTELGDGYTRYDWEIHYPINSYCVSVNIGKYAHFSEMYKPKDGNGELPLDFYCLPENLEKAKRQFAQAHGMLDAYTHYFGEYPFAKDGFKLIEVGYAGMEHQSAVTYGNRFANGYLERDWTGVGISPRFDFIIIHEAGHEWFGNAVSAADKADMWIQEGWCTYMEGLYVEYHWGKEDAIKYLNGYKSKVANRVPIVGTRGTAASPPQDQYFKGALFLNTLRTVMDDDAKWFALIRNFYQAKKYRNILTEEVVAFFNKETGREWTPVFHQYLRRAALPTFVAGYDGATKTLTYQWKAEEEGFDMPVKIGGAGKEVLLHPTTRAQTMQLAAPLTREELTPDASRYYVGTEITP